MSLTYVLLFVFCINFVYGNDARWKDCKDTFCKDLRNSGESLYNVDLQSIITTENGTLVASLKTPSSQKELPLKLEIRVLEEEIFHISIDQEIPTIPPRYKAHDALVNSGKYFSIAKLNKTATSNQTVTATYKDLKVIIYESPFKLEFYNGNRLISAINENNRFVFQTDPQNKNMRLDISFKDAHHAYGIPEHADHLALRNTVNDEPYRHFNLDYGAYELESTQALYGSVGILYAHGNNYSSGAFWLNAAETWIDINTDSNVVNATFMSASGLLDLFVLIGPTLPQAVHQYSKLTGVAPLPQIFTLGYHQSRYSYMNQTDVMNVVKNFDNHSLPLDVMWLDIDYTDEKRYFTWDPVRFDDPQKLINDLVNTNRKLVAIIDPHIKVDGNYFVHTNATEKKYYVLRYDGRDFQGDCWPGLSSYLDFFNPEALNYYSTLYLDHHFQNKNVHVWNDMNEPAVFNIPDSENSMPLNAIHHGDYEHKDVHNMYGFYQTIGTRKGMLNRTEKVRPFILTRSHFAGTQRYAAMWTGDNVAKWEYLRISFPMCLTEALSGISFCGADVGGFSEIPDNELYQRWYQAGAWLPFYRGHSAIDVPRREPYLYEPEIQKRVRKALNQRYSHIPLWYTLFYEHEQTGEPVIRPITYHYPQESKAFEVEYQVLLGSNVLAAPVLQQNISNISVYLPGGENEIWYNIDENYKPYQGIGAQLLSVTLDSVPVFYKGGSIIPRKDSVKLSTPEMHQDPYTLYIVLNGSGHAEGKLYIDDGETFAYESSNHYYVNFVFDSKVLKFINMHNDSKYDDAAPIENLVIINPPVNVTRVEKFENHYATNLSMTSNGNVLLVNHCNAKLQNEFEIRIITNSCVSVLAVNSTIFLTLMLSIIRNYFNL